MKTNVTINEGSFTVTLNEGNEFGSEAFDGSVKYLQVNVSPAGENNYDALSRNMLTPTPYSHYAANADLLDGVDSSGFLSTSGGGDFRQSAGWHDDS